MISDDYSKNFDDLIDEISSFGRKASEVEVINVLNVGAKAFVIELKKLPKPKSIINKAGYTHMIDSFTLKTKGSKVEVGWGKYYGKMVELGTNKMKAQPHFYPAWEKNKEKILSDMVQHIYK